jgi:hypothetical protein
VYSSSTHSFLNVAGAADRGSIAGAEERQGQASMRRK